MDGNELAGVVTAQAVFHRVWHENADFGAFALALYADTDGFAHGVFLSSHSG
jgi:hypothetical protein